MAAGVENRPFVITDDDESGVLVILTLFCIVYSLGILLMRVGSNYRSFHLDDWLAVAATALALPQFLLIHQSAVAGSGKVYSAISPKAAQKIGDEILISQIFLLLSSAVVKCSVLGLCRRLFSVNEPRGKLACLCMMAFVALWCIGSIIGLLANCGPLTLIGFTGTTCRRLTTRWAVIGITDALTELATFTLSIVLIWPLQVKFWRKFQAVLCFVLRLPIIVFIVMQIQSVREFTMAHNKGISLVTPLCLRQGQLFYSLLSATVPTMNKYLRKFETAESSMYPSQLSSQSNAGGRSFRALLKKKKNLGSDSVNSDPIKIESPGKGHEQYDRDQMQNSIPTTSQEMITLENTGYATQHHSLSPTHL